MVKHIVMWTFHENALGKSKQDNLFHARKLLLEMEGHIPGLISIECELIEKTDAASWDLVLNTIFEDMQSLIQYQSHPVHEEVKKFIAQVRNQRAVADWVV